MNHPQSTRAWHISSRHRASPTMQHLAIVIRDDAYDRILTPLTFAYVQAREGVSVDILFVLWAARILTEQGAGAARVDGRHAAEEAWLRDRLESMECPSNLLDYIRLVKGAGDVNLFACSIAAATFEVTNDALIPEATGIVDASWFLNERAIKADHCQYF